MGTRLPVVEAAGSVVSALPMPAAASPAFVLGRYEVRERLGEGGMGMVHRGHDPVLDRAVAIKMIGLNMAKDELPDYEARFYQEARAAGGLAHQVDEIVREHRDLADIEHRGLLMAVFYAVL